MLNTYFKVSTDIFIYQKHKMRNMPLIPMAIQQGMSATSFIIMTLKTNPLGMLGVFTVADMVIRKYYSQNKIAIKNNFTIAMGALATTLITGPFLIEWSKSIYYYINDKIVDISDDFFNYSSALGMG